MVTKRKPMPLTERQKKWEKYLTQADWLELVLDCKKLKEKFDKIAEQRKVSGNETKAKE